MWDQFNRHAVPEAADFTKSIEAADGDASKWKYGHFTESSVVDADLVTIQVEAQTWNEEL